MRLALAEENMTAARIIIFAPETRIPAIVSKLPGAVADEGKAVISSALKHDSSLNDHLVWLWGMLKHERRFINNLKTEGVRILCECEARKGEIKLFPNGAEMLHLLGAELEVKVR